MLYRTQILHDETTFFLRNVPENMTEILNDPDYFNPIEILGIETIAGHLKLFEAETEELL